ncbi:ABC transporter substrate-binding protein [Alsobacter metallidurans]|uniref:ABC transporter substrate-binding protein n=1 Tax=Alsobacter metallidurans TaxID=340221 RepID=A0A917MKT5_9HYPH|nr:amino acid ABC transporter substrate-binding protein [Alsobacter metallidurans]GGH25670.1 ABC transporter substrate-binding protein [Alsobacter metallidurans]
MTSGLLRVGLGWIALALTVAVAAPAVGQGAAPERVILFVDREGDPWYARLPGHDGVARIERQSSLPGAELAAKDGRAAGRALGVTFKVVRRTLKADEPVGVVLTTAAAEGVRAAVLDLPGADLLAAATAAPSMALFNVRDEEDSLRADACRGTLFHVIPSRSMRTDALAQLLVRRNWKKILVLEGPEPGDIAYSAAMQASAKKFGARVVAVRPFTNTNDPRRREESNIGLLTGGDDYDVVFVSDLVGEYGRMAPYRTILPRPVVGTEGLRALAWHPAAERNGAPQLNRRFERDAGRPMQSEDWAAWAAVRAAIDAETRSAGDAAPGALVSRLMRPDMSLELYKAYPGSFRAWDHQLRQGVFLATHNAVIDLAPIEGFLHETNTLDTLGPPPNRSPCGR